MDENLRTLLISLIGIGGLVFIINFAIGYVKTSNAKLNYIIAKTKITKWSNKDLQGLLQNNNSQLNEYDKKLIREILNDENSQIEKIFNLYNMFFLKIMNFFKNIFTSKK